MYLGETDGDQMGRGRVDTGRQMREMNWAECSRTTREKDHEQTQPHSKALAHHNSAAVGTRAHRIDHRGSDIPTSGRRA